MILKERFYCMTPMRRLVSLLIFLTIFMFACGSINADLVNPTQLASNDLSKQDFSGKYMVGVDLSHKNLRDANFTFTDLIHADFSYSDCTGAIFDYAQLRGANFTGATLDAKWAQIMNIITTGEGSGLDLQGYDLSHIRITDANFSGTNLEDADLSTSILAGSNFKNANLSNANLKKTDLSNSTLYGAKATNEQIASGLSNVNLRVEVF